VEVHGLDLKSRSSAEASLPELADALHRFNYLLIRDQHLSPAQHVSIAKLLAPLLGATLPPTSAGDNGILDENLVPGCPEIVPLGSKQNGFDDENAFGLPINNSVKGIQWPEQGACSWHADGPAFGTVGTFTFINMIKAPAVGQGGTTLYVSGHELYEALSPTLREKANRAMVRYIEDGNWKYECVSSNIQSSVL
jgi:alpha-ketoglutarate-dependent taurine dioxygenase